MTRAQMQLLTVFVTYLTYAGLPVLGFAIFRGLMNVGPQILPDQPLAVWLIALAGTAFQTSIVYRIVTNMIEEVS